MAGERVTMENMQAYMEMESYDIPWVLFEGGRYRKLSNDARILYGVLGSRDVQSMLDESGERYAVCKRDELGLLIGISKKTAIKVMRELADAGLVREERPGQGEPNRIYLCDPVGP